MPISAHQARGVLLHIHQWVYAKITNCEQDQVSVRQVAQALRLISVKIVKERKHTLRYANDHTSTCRHHWFALLQWCLFRMLYSLALSDSCVGQALQGVACRIECRSHPLVYGPHSDAGHQCHIKLVYRFCSNKLAHIVVLCSESSGGHQGTRTSSKTKVRRSAAPTASAALCTDSLLMTESYQNLEPERVGEAARLRQDRYGLQDAE